MVANFESLTLAKSMGQRPNWSLSRWGKSTGNWAEKDMGHVLELAQAAKVPVPLGGLVDQLVKGINQERMKTLLG
jgi:3-hydroxyisobutyrate dehydrogenase-like beta-hydroxyacid dehydrogenase